MQGCFKAAPRELGQGGHHAGVRGVEGLPVADADPRQEGEACLHREHRHGRPFHGEVEHVLRLDCLEHQLVQGEVAKEDVAVETPARLLLYGKSPEE